MNKRLVVLSLLLSLAAGAAVADGQHYATAPTKKDAKRLATAQAQAAARDQSLCYRPARQVDECQAVEGGFRCRAETSARDNTCRHAGWVNRYTVSQYARLHTQWRDDPSTPWLFDRHQGPVPSGLYGVSVPPDAGPPPPTPFPTAN